MNSWWNKIKLGFAYSPLHSLFFKAPSQDWETKSSIVNAPIRPWFAVVPSGGSSKLDKALETAKSLVLEHKGEGLTNRFTKIKKETPCKIILVPIEELYKFKGPSKIDGRQSVTVKGWRNTKILTNKFVPEWLGHELIHWAEWYYNIPGDEAFAYKYESQIARILR